MRKLFSLIAAVLFAGSMMADNFALVTSVSDLADGDQIIITNKDADRAISTTQNNNNRGVAQVTATNDVIVPDETVQIITLVADGSNFMLQVGEDAYLYAASNSSNHLKTSTAATAGDNGKFAITIAADSIASVIAQGTNQRNDLRYNTSGMFSCYASSTSVEAGLKIFKNQNGGGVVPPTPADTYTVAGSDAAIFGETWNPALAANDMTLTNGIYKWEKAELDLTAGDIEFKVVKNHSWDVAYPASNYVLNIAEEGEYTITITFDPATEAVAAEAVKNEPLADPTNCAEAAAAALSVSANNELYNNGAVYTIEGYVTSIKTAYSDQYHNISFWMADTQDGGEVIQAYRAACASEADAPAVGDKVAVTGSLTKYGTTPEFAAACTFVILHDSTPVDPQTETIYDWAGEIGTTVFGGNSNITTGTVKIHENTDDVNGIKFGSSYVYADGKWIAIKPAEGGFKAGDVLSVSVVFNNSDATKYCMVDLRAADGDTRIWMSDSLSTLNGRNAGEPIVQTYTLAADQDSLFLGRYGNTGMFITLLKVERALVPPTPQPTVNYYVAGSMNGWGPAEAYMLTPNNASLYEGEFTFAANDEFKVIGFDGENTTWYPDGMANNFKITEAGDYKITFNPAGNVEGWYAGFFNVVKKEAPIVHQYEVAEAIAAGLQENDEVLVRGIITRMEFKGKNFAKYGSVNIYVADATGAEGEFEFFNCYSLNADTFRTSIPNYDPESTAWAQFNEVADANGNAIHVGDTVIAFGKYKLYNSTHELNTGCYLVDIKHAPQGPAETITIDIESEVNYVDYVAVAGWWQFMVENDEYEISISNVSTTQAAGTYTIADLDADYSYVFIKADSTEVHFVDGSLELTEGEDGSRTIEGTLTGDDGNIYNIKLVFRIPTAETIVNVEIPEWGVVDAAGYYGVTGTIFYGEAADGTYIQFVVLGNNPIGTFTYDDMYVAGIEVAGKNKPIYSMNVTVNASDAMRAIITMDILCVNNTLYHVTTTIGEGINNVEDAVKAIKSIVNGQVVIEKAGKTFNMNGQVIR